MACMGPGQAGARARCGHGPAAAAPTLAPLPALCPPRGRAGLPASGLPPVAPFHLPVPTCHPPSQNPLPPRSEKVLHLRKVRGSGTVADQMWALRADLLRNLGNITNRRASVCYTAVLRVCCSAQSVVVWRCAARAWRLLCSYVACKVGVCAPH